MARRRTKPNVVAPAAKDATQTIPPAEKHGAGNRIVALLKHPITSLVISAGVSIVLYWLAVAEMSPRFAVHSSEIVASKENSVEGLQVLFRGKEVDIVRRERVLLWNAGHLPIAKTTISATQPICIVYPESVTLLDYRVSSTSRSNLKFQLQPNLDGTRCLSVQIVGDEALEQDDGGVVELLYAGPEQAAFLVTGRVKGVKDGFQKESWERVVLKQMEPKDWFYTVNLLMLSLTGVLMYWKEIRQYRAGQANNLAVASYFFFPVIFLNAWSLKPFLVGLSWAH